MPRRDSSEAFSIWDPMRSGMVPTSRAGPSEAAESLSSSWGAALWQYSSRFRSLSRGTGITMHRRKTKGLVVTVAIPAESTYYLAGCTRGEFDPRRLRAGVSVLFDGRSGLTPEVDPRVSNKGYLPDVELLAFVVRLMAACANLRDTPRAQEVLLSDFSGQRCSLDFARSGRTVVVRLLRTSSGLARSEVLAETETPLERLLTTCLELSLVLRENVQFLNSRMLGTSHFRALDQAIAELKTRSIRPSKGARGR